MIKTNKSIISQTIKLTFTRVILCILVSVLLTLFLCRKSIGPGAGSDPNDLLPLNDDISGFTKKGTAASMNDYQTILDAIDGAAEKYIDYGFVEGVQQIFTNGSIDIDVRIFNHGNEFNAKAIFNEFYPSSPEIISQDDRLVVVDHSIMTGYTIYYQRHNIYIEIVTYEKSNFALNMGKQFFWNIDGKIGTN